MTSIAPLAAVLFDLDGTLIDTAPDMVGAINDMLVADGREPLPYAPLRMLVSHGSRALVERAYAPNSEAEMADLVARFLHRYSERVACQSGLFDGMAKLLDGLDSAALPWGIVTNKPAGLTTALLDALDLSSRAGVVVAGDSLSEKKPHPMPMLHAAAALAVKANHCLCVGDAQRDIQAGRAAGMATVAVAYGYILPDDCATRWRADFVVDDVDHLSGLIARWLPGGARTCHGHN